MKKLAAIIDKTTIDNLNKQAGSDAPEQVASHISGIIGSALTKVILPVAAFIVIAFGIYGAVLYFTAYGNEEKAARGKNTILWAIVGAIVVAAAFILVRYWVSTELQAGEVILPAGENTP